MTTSTTKAPSNIVFWLSYALRYKYSYLFGILMLFLTNGLAVNLPQYIGHAIDLLEHIKTDVEGEIQRTVMIVAVLAVSMIVTRTASRMFFFNPGRAVERDVKNDAFSKLTGLQKDFYDEHASGKLISIVNNDVNGIRALSGVVMLQVFNIMFALSMTPLKMWQISPELTMYCVVPVVTTFLISRKAIGNMRRLMKKRMEELQELSGKTVELLSGIDVLRSHNVRGWAEGVFAKENDQLLDLSIQLTRIRTLYMPLLGYTDRIIKVVVLAVGGLYVINADLTLGELVAFLSYATLLAMPFFSMAMIWSAFHNGMVAITSLRKILDRQLPPQDSIRLAPDDKNKLFSQGIEVRNLTYRYPDQDRAALQDISFHINPGETVGILGQVGSGKSTLVNCLNHILDVPDGCLFLDGIDINHMARADWRSVVRTVTQEPFLFSDSVVNNVEFGASEKPELAPTLKRAAMADEVSKFPQGIETMVGEKGILLSGGQKQRLSLARAIHTPAKLLVLDNVLSAVDNDTERYLLNQLFKNLGDGAALIVSHRASVLERVDHVLVLEQGRIVARGHHEELMKSSPIYQEIWRLQQEEAAESSEIEA